VYDLPIDRSFQKTWKKTETYLGLTVWRNATAKLGILGTRVAINLDECTGCLKCLVVCPVDVFQQYETPSQEVKVAPVKESDCLECLACEVVCPVEVLLVTRSVPEYDTLKALLDEN
jgi:NAD-dependent dihydropyrimidine dehydrogenase PreA subunit